MSKRKIVSLALIALIALSLLPIMMSAAGAQPVAATREVDAATGATPNYRTFLRNDLKSMPYEGGYYSCLKASAPFTFFHENWFGVPLSYLLDTEVGLKAGTTGIKVIADDGYSTTLTLAELRMTNPEGFHTILAWKKGPENDKNAALSEIADTEGPFRLIVPQAVIGAHGVGTDNFNRAVQRVRAIEIQPTPPGLPSAVPDKIPAGQITVYGNVQNRRTFTVSALKSITSHSGTYKWRNSFPTNGQSKLVGMPLPYFLQQPVGLLAGSTNVTAIAADGYSITFTMNQATMTYPDGNPMLIAWNEDMNV